MKLAHRVAALWVLATLMILSCGHAITITLPPSGPPYVYWQRLAGDPGTPTPIQGFGNSTIGLIGHTYSPGSADGDGNQARFQNPSGIAVSEMGELYISDSANHTIRKMAGGNVTTLAGVVGSPGTQNGNGTAAQFNNPQGLVVGKNGDVFVAEMGSHRIRKISPNGAVTNWSGDPGQPGGVNGTGTAARFNKPSDVAIDGSGNLYVADSGNHVIRKITPAGLVSTFAGMIGTPGSLDGYGANARFRSPQGVAVDARGNVYVADTANGLIRKISPYGVVSTVAGTVNNGTEPPLGRENLGLNANPGLGAPIKFPTDIEVDVPGNLYVTDCGSRKVLRITPSGALSSLGINEPNQGFLVTSTIVNPVPADLAVSTNGRLFLADAGNHWIHVGQWANISEIAPYFVTHPASTSAYSGDSIWLTATALATTDSIQPSGPVTYTWFLNGRQIQSSGSGSLLVRVSPYTVGTYHVVASNALGYDTSLKAELSLKPAAAWEWLNDSSNQTIAQGGNATFGVKNVTGPGVIRYQWMKDGQPIYGATSSQLSVARADISAAGLYTLSITSSAGKVTTPPVRLIIEEPGLLIYSIRGTGNTARSPEKKSFSFSGTFVIDRVAQKAAFLWQDVTSKTYSIERRDDLAAHSTGPSSGTTTVFTATASNGTHPATENETIWFTGTDGIVYLGGNPPLRTLAPFTLAGQLNSLTFDQGTTIQTQSATLTLDSTATLKSRQLRESLEDNLVRRKSELDAAGFVEIAP